MYKHNDIQNLLPDICNIYHKQYCVKQSETSPLTCEICGQGSHNECILHKMNVSEEEIDAFGLQEAAARLNPTRLTGVHYLQHTSRPGTTISKHKEQRMHEQPQEDPSNLQPQTTLG